MQNLCVLRKHYSMCVCVSAHQLCAHYKEPVLLHLWLFVKLRLTDPDGVFQQSCQNYALFVDLRFACHQWNLTPQTPHQKQSPNQLLFSSYRHNFVCNLLTQLFSLSLSTSVSLPFICLVCYFPPIVLSSETLEFLAIALFHFHVTERPVLHMASRLPNSLSVHI